MITNLKLNVEGITLHDGPANQKPDDQEMVRRLRNGLLSASDWTQIPGNALSDSDQTAWSTYRQELRDITLQDGFPYSVVWPTKPM